MSQNMFGQKNRKKWFRRFVLLIYNSFPAFELKKKKNIGLSVGGDIVFLIFNFYFVVVYLICFYK